MMYRFSTLSSTNEMRVLVKILAVETKLQMLMQAFRKVMNKSNNFEY